MRTPVDLSKSAKAAAFANGYKLLAKHGEEELR
jgi:hypothetical protein